MYPNLFGIEGFSMVAMILIGVIAAVIIVSIYLKRVKYSLIDFILCVLVTAFFGIVFGILFENIYEAIKISLAGGIPHWTWAMTFYGGLFGGVIAFLLMYKFYYRRSNPSIIKELLIIAPCGITAAHGFGRLGCFLSGCCYGIPTDAWFGIQFPGMAQKVIPTQLFEMIFLFILSIILGILAFKNITRYTMPIYMIAYAIFRFVIEFFRGDERGQLAGLSPSQYWCILLFVGAFVLIFFYKKKIFTKEQK